MFSKKSHSIYLDHAAATPLDERVFSAMQPFLQSNGANPSALYGPAVEARKAIDDARARVAGHLLAQPDTIIFTSSGTESTNMAILGIAQKHENIPPKADQPLAGKTKKHIITTRIEHHAVLEPIGHLEKQGFDVTYLDVDEHGIVDVEAFKKALRPETLLVSIMYANNELGSIQPIAEIGREILKWRKQQGSVYPLYHSDARQAAQYLDLSVERLHVDLLTLNGSKIYGPKGVGVLYRRRGIELQPIMHGGGQEFGLRPGTENVAAIVGFAKALDVVREDVEANTKAMDKLMAFFEKQIKKQFPNATVNGPDVFIKEDRMRLPSHVSVTFPGVDAEALILYLSAKGIYVSSGSACTTDSDEVSHVLRAIGLLDEQAKQTIRFSFGKDIKKKDLKKVVSALKEEIEKMT